MRISFLFPLFRCVIAFAMAYVYIGVYMVKLFTGILVAALFLGGVVAWWNREEGVAVVFSTVLPLLSPLPSLPPSPSPSPTPTPTASPLQMVLYDVPFTAQAPTANWNDSLYQNACEEASILMAGRYLSRKGITSQQALVEIKALANRADALFGSHLDESAFDTATLARDALPNAAVELIKDATIQDIVHSLVAGKVVLVPLNGKILKNPNYKPPGPVRHMLVVKGYDPNTQEFITNDPGTRRGEGYRYSQDLLLAAMHDWDTGNNTQTHPDRKVVIAIGKAAP